MAMEVTTVVVTAKTSMDNVAADPVGEKGEEEVTADSW